MRRISFVLLLFLVFHAGAESAGQDVDDLLTNAKLRAESGSKSRWSVALQLAYNGGSVLQPFGAARPNITETTGTTPYTDIDGLVNIKYNLTTRDSFLFGGGVRWVTPFQGLNSPKHYSIQKVDAFDPSMNWQRIYKLWGAQSYFQFGPTYYTRSDLVAEGYLVNLGIYNVNAWDIGTTGLTVGVESGVTWGFFKNPVEPTTNRSEEEVRDDQSDYNFNFNPYFEYKFNDTLNLRVGSDLISYEHTRLADQHTWRHDTVTVTAGVGISLTRDIFLFPNVVFLPDQLRPKDTNVGVTADVNVF